MVAYNTEADVTLPWPTAGTINGTAKSPTHLRGSRRSSREIQRQGNLRKPKEREEADIKKIIP